MNNKKILDYRPMQPLSGLAKENCFVTKDDTLRSSIYIKEFEKFVLQQGFPCIGARTAVNSKTITYGIFGKMDGWHSPYELAGGLSRYLAYMKDKPSNFLTYVAIYKDDGFDSELSFETHLWKLLRRLHRLDVRYHRWSREVDSDPNSRSFSFSFGEQAFFMVGMHPGSSRKARRFSYPAIAFNLHSQFEELRKKNRYNKIKKVVRENEIDFDGSINPMLSDFGDGLEAPQYSGRQVGADWKCPFKAMKG